MARVFIGVGSNIKRAYHISLALEFLGENFTVVTCSSVYQGEAIGFKGDDFFNLVVLIETDLTVVELSKQLREFELQHGRPAEILKASSRTIDLDILSYDNFIGDYDGVILPRAEILYNAFVLQPLAEIAANNRHPVDGRTYAELWSLFDCGDQRLQKLTGSVLSD